MGIFLVYFLCYLDPHLILCSNFIIARQPVLHSRRTFEGIRLLAPAISIVVLTLIDATVYTAITAYFLLKKESA